MARIHPKFVFGLSSENRDHSVSLIAENISYEESNREGVTVVIVESSTCKGKVPPLIQWPPPWFPSVGEALFLSLKSASRKKKIENVLFKKLRSFETSLARIKERMEANGRQKDILLTSNGQDDIEFLSKQYLFHLVQNKARYKVVDRLKKTKHQDELKEEIDDDTLLRF